MIRRDPDGRPLPQAAPIARVFAAPRISPGAANLPEAADRAAQIPGTGRASPHGRRPADPTLSLAKGGEKRYTVYRRKASPALGRFAGAGKSETKKERQNS